MAVARTGTRGLSRAATLAPPVVPTRPRVPERGLRLPRPILPEPGPPPEPWLPPRTSLPLPPTTLDDRDAVAVATTLPAGCLRRCVFRRVELLAPGGRGRAVASYAVTCLHPDEPGPVALGDVRQAVDACAVCVAPGIFRADEA